MNKLGRREYLKLICEAMVREYGNTLVEWGTDVKMASRILSRLRKYLHFSSEDMTAKEWVDWRVKFLAQQMNRTEAEIRDTGYVEEIQIPSR